MENNVTRKAIRPTVKRYTLDHLQGGIKRYRRSLVVVRRDQFIKKALPKVLAYQSDRQLLTSKSSKPLSTLNVGYEPRQRV